MRAGSRNGLELLARLGYAARGTVNLIIGLLALLASLGHGSGTTGSKGALELILSQPLGAVLVAIVAIGLFGFALWRGLQALVDADGLGRSAKSIALRVGRGFSALVYIGLGVLAVGLLTGRSIGGNDQEARSWTAWLLFQPLGPWLVAAIGIGIMGVAVGIAAKAWTASFRWRLACDEAAARWVIPLGRIGFAARGIVFFAAGVFLVAAAYWSDPYEAHGLGGALQALQEEPFGRTLYAIVAAGMAAFGAFGFVEAWYRRIHAPKAADVGREIKVHLT